MGRVDLTVATDGALRPADAGRVDHRTQRRDGGRGLDGGGDLVGLGHVDAGEDATDLGGERLALLDLHVGDDDDGALGGQWRATAAPMPEAAPVTIADAPLMSMPGILGCSRIAQARGLTSVTR